MVASLRTRTGCLACRGRRKKCDERKPICLRCSKSNTSCTWPLDDQIDRRRLRRKRHNAGPSAASSHSDQESIHSSHHPSFPADDNDCGQVVPRVATIGVDSGLLGLPLFIVEYFLPFEFHRPNFVNMADVSYLVSMCCKSSFIRNSVEACAMIALPSDCTMVAQDLYRTAVQEISARIKHGLLRATDDELLAAIVWLCVFENSQFEGGLCTSIHLKALSNLLLLREPMDPDSAAPNALAWERMCVESFVYHSAVTTLFDDKADASITARVLNRYERCVSPMALNLTLASLSRSVFQSPILGAPCDIFLILMRATQLVRQADPLSFEDEMVCRNQYSEIYQWQLTLDGACAMLADARVWMGKIYAVTARIMLLHIILSASSTRLIEASRIEEISSVKSELAQLLGTAETYLDRTWSKFILWPVAIFGAISLLQEETRTTQHLLTIIAKRGHCSTPTLVQKVLEERVWPLRPMLPKQDELYLSMDGLRTILNADIMLGMASALTASTSALQHFRFVITPRASLLVEKML